MDTLHSHTRRPNTHGYPTVKSTHTYSWIPELTHMSPTYSLIPHNHTHTYRYPITTSTLRNTPQSHTRLHTPHSPYGDCWEGSGCSWALGCHGCHCSCVWPPHSVQLPCPWPSCRATLHQPPPARDTGPPRSPLPGKGKVSTQGTPEEPGHCR